MSDERAGSSGRRPQQKGRRSIRFHVLSIVLVQAALLTGLVALAANEDLEESVETARLSLVRDVDVAARTVGADITEMREILGNLGAFASFFVGADPCSLATVDEQDGSGIILHVYEPGGSLNCSSVSASERRSQRGYDAPPWRDKLAALPAATVLEEGPIVDPVSGSLALVFAAKLPEPPRTVIFAIPIDTVAAGLRDGDSDPSYMVVAKNRSAVYDTDGPDNPSAPIGRTPLARRLPAKGKVLALGGHERIYAEATVPDLGWHVVGSMSIADARAPALASMWIWVTLASMALLIGLGLGYQLLRRIERPVRNLTAAVEAATEGDLTTEVPTAGPSELARLSERFNEMLEVRARAERTLENALHRERTALERLREVDSMKDTFLMAISHDLRTPLTAVVGYASTLLQRADDLPPEQSKDMLQRLERQAQRLEKLLIDLLDLDRIGRGVLDARRRPTDMDALVRTIATSSARNGDVRVSTRAGTADVDPALVERIVENLVANAVKHTPAGTRIEVDARREKRSIVITVADDGPGVPDDLKEAIFEPFRHGNDVGASPGTGVGLALVGRFAAAHGGRAWVEDRAKGGSAFRVSLPGAIAPARRSRRAPAATRSKKPSGGTATRARVRAPR
jgi:signal transduction histidine kinase